MDEKKSFALISLGCAKNLVNSEQMLYLLDEAGYTLTPEPAGADLAIVNTCGFIDAAKSEAIDTILEMAELKKAGQLGGLIVCGCLSERYQGSILQELPEIDAVLGVGSFGDIVKALHLGCDFPVLLPDLCQVRTAADKPEPAFRHRNFHRSAGL